MKSLVHIGIAFAAVVVMLGGPVFAGDKDGEGKAGTAGKNAAKLTAAGATVTSDSLKMLKGGMEAVYSGNVLLNAGFQMCSGELKFLYARPGDVSEMNASGGVMFVQGTRVAKADSAHYDKAGRTLKLLGNAVASQCGTVVSGETITIDIDADNVKIEAAGGKKVKMVAMPRKKSCQGKQSGEEIKCKLPR